ncbi:glycosyltransferase family 2 protein [Rhodospirillaceae bacterium SYSU D60014]|uniref:glycosyltransferase n=1 Tax=Virgifigura deserti TaxID=2268457 RepID=UPI000E668543
MTGLAFLVLLLAAIPVLITMINLPFYRRLPLSASTRRAVSVLIPARDEETNIGETLTTVLTSKDVEIEVIVLDDHSSDRTAAVAQSVARRDDRLRVERAPPLPPGWSGKQHACQVLADLARHDLLLFIDADVRLAPDAVSRMAAFLADRPTGLLSGFPRQITATLGEKLVVPIILFLLLGYLPMPGLRWTTLPVFGAACGQLIMVKREAYDQAGGHAAIRRSLHDGIKLPRAFRAKGLQTDLFDATDIAYCRMYAGARAVWKGFSKNATEGMATLRGLPLWAILLAGGHVLPFVLIGLAPFVDIPAGAVVLALLAALLSIGLRLFIAYRFRQSILGAILHPVGILITLAIQVVARIKASLGIRPVWRGRSYHAS